MRLPDLSIANRVQIHQRADLIKQLYMYCCTSKFVMMSHACSTSPFGSLMPTRSWSDVSREYRYGFNGKEKDFETANDDYDFGARIYDGRLGRWLSLDPMMKKYSDLSPFVFAGNGPIFFIDRDGNEISSTDAFKKSPYNSVYTKLLSNNSAFNTLISKYKTQEYNLTLHYGENDQVPNGATAQTFITGKENQQHKLVGATADAYFSSRTSIMTIKSEITEDGKTYIVTKTRSEIAIARTLLHEALHSYIYSLDKTEDQKHNLFSQYRNKLMEGLIEYNKDNKLGYTEKQLTILSWDGLQESKQFEEYIKKNYQKDGMTYNEARSAWVKEKDELSYKEKSRKEKVTTGKNPKTEGDTTKH